MSTVDSGNLAGHLIVVANACREMAAARCSALPRSTASRTRCAWRARRSTGSTRRRARRPRESALAEAIDAVAAHLASPRADVPARADRMSRMRGPAEALV